LKGNVDLVVTVMGTVEVLVDLVVNLEEKREVLLLITDPLLG
jgi:hypothetical protein